MESCEDDTEVESVDGSSSFSSGTETELDDKPSDTSLSTSLANLEGCDTKIDEISHSSQESDEKHDSTGASTLKSGNVFAIHCSNHTLSIDVKSLRFFPS